MKKKLTYQDEYLIARSFLQGQLEQYKLEFIETHNEKYIEAMHEYRSCLDFLMNLDNAYRKTVKENNELKNL